ncbi:MAG: hypothetical protein LBQ66_12270, partial [Planctomycetaceae bacterium]|nr:hypothetical protein [Planctomycetaceae bacterium]
MCGITMCPARLSALGNQMSLEGTPRRFGVQFKLVWFYYTQRRAGTPAFQSAPLRGNCRRLRRHWAFWFCRCVLAIQLSACADA